MWSRVGEHGVSLFGNPHAAELARQVGEVGHFDARDVIEIAGIVAVAADAVGDLADAAGNIGDRLMEALPLAGNAGAVLVVVAFAEAGDEQRLCRFRNAAAGRLSVRVESMGIGS